jgi:hypothetical protein
MKKTLLLFLIGFSNMLYAQDLLVKPGQGCGDIKLGMTEKEVIKLLNFEFTEKNYEEEMKDFKSSGINFHIDSIIQFVLGFDKCLTTKNSFLEASPIYLLYFKDNKLNFIGITSYSVDEKIMKSVFLDKKIRFHQSQESCTKILGDKYLPISYGDYTGDHLYYERGLEMTYDENKLTFIGIFTPDPRIPEMINEKRKKLQEQFNALDN